jgi:1,4-alpha-glucan branching enzyme
MSKAKNSTLPYLFITDFDIFLFKEGTHFELFKKLGSHPMVVKETMGTHFAVWAPHAKSVSVIGDFNGWNKHSHPLFLRWDHSGIWEGFIPGVSHGCIYKYFIVSHINDTPLEKGDPFAFSWEIPPKTASVVWDLSYTWNEKNWDAIKEKKNHLNAPMSIYELHFGSWQRNSSHHSLSYLEMSRVLPPYLKEMGFTHVEFMPMMEHPFYGSWGYQKTGYFAPSSRYGTPQEFMQLIEALHEHHIGVFLDWVPSHFPSDIHGLACFDGSCLFEHADPRQGFHPDWKSFIFNYTRHEVRSFLISSAVFWLETYHVDGLRVDAVSSMLYLDYSRKHNEWMPNIYGGNENLEAISFLKCLNEYLYAKFPHIQMIAEESTSWPKVSKPTFHGGVGFGLKWNMGWMHDTLDYFSKDPLYRKHHHHHFLFSMYYFFNENFVLSLSHDEVVYGKKSLLSKMPGDDWQKFANLRLLYSYMYAHPGKKLLFMGSEIGQWNEWNHDAALDWYLLQYSPHEGIQKLLKDLNHLYQQHPALYQLDFQYEGFQWLTLHDSDHSVLSFLRKAKHPEETLLAVCNFTPIPRYHYCVEVKEKSSWELLFNSDLNCYGGSHLPHHDVLHTSEEETHIHRLYLTLPPLGALFFKRIS